MACNRRQRIDSLRSKHTLLQECTTVYKLLGKRVFLFFATHTCYKSGAFLPALKKIYHEMKKGRHDDFEIIYISLDCDESPSFPLSVKEMPWLVHAYEPDFAASVVEQVFRFPFSLPAIAAFGDDGHIVAKESGLAFKKEWNSEYPFIEADMGKQVHKELLCMHKWDLEILKGKVKKLK